MKSRVVWLAVIASGQTAVGQPADDRSTVAPAPAPAVAPTDPAPTDPAPTDPAPTDPAPEVAPAPAAPPVAAQPPADPPARAATPGQPELAPEVIEVQSRWPEADLFNVDHTTRATTTRRIRGDARGAVIGDLLDGIPGVAVQRTGAGQGAPVVRGLIGSAVLVVVDGMRLNNAIFRPAPNQYTALIDPLAVSRIEVTRGPGSTLFGSDAIGGVINVITPVPRFVGEDWQRTATASALAATADRSIVGRVTASTGRKGSGVAIGTTLQRHGDVRSGGGAMQEPSAYDSVAVDATGHLEHGRHATTAWLQLVEQPSLPRTDELNIGFGQTEPGSAEFRYQPSRRSFAHVRHILRKPAGSLEGVELHAAWQRIRDDRKTRATGSDEELVELNHDDSLGLAARAVGPLLGGELSFGADYWFDRVSSARTSRDIVSNVVMPDTSRFADGSTMNQLGGFAEARRVIGPVALRSSLRAGLTRVKIAQADRDLGGTIDSVNWAGELGAELALGDQVALVANAGRAFRAPNVQDLSGLGPRPGNRYQVPSTALGDEQALGADLGVRARRDLLELEVFGFGLINDGRIEVVPTGEVRPDGRAVVVSANTAEARMLGIEGSIRVKPHPTVELEAQATWVRGSQTTVAGDEPADRLPPLGGRAGVRWRALPRLMLEGSVRGALAQRRLSDRDRDDPRIDPMGTPRFATLHLGVGVELGDFQLVVRADNLLDRNYREHGSGTAAPGFDASLLVRWAPSDD
jgi:hemoglobin/transferrin/lactoferrin receptor protein